ncbi:MAG: terminase family protein, partial [Planctomycetota bacterium]|nr:terminase family protein [Planctomycetota bacterium]
MDDPLRVTRDQAAVVECPARFIALMAGRRWGKTTAIRARLLYRALRIPEWTAWYVSPSYALAYELFRSIVFSDEISPHISSQKIQPYPRIWLGNGATIAFRSFDRPANLRGFGLHELWVDEIQDVRERDFWPVLRPLLSDRRGVLGIAGQPRGKNWYWKQLVEPGLAGRQGYRTFIFPASTGIAYRGPEGKAELELVRSQLTERDYLQEYECIPVEPDDAAFRAADLDAAIRGGFEPPIPGVRYVAGLDLGRVADQTAWVILRADTGQVVACGERPLGEPHETQARIVSAEIRRYGAAVWIDATGGATGGHGPQDAYLVLWRKYLGACTEVRLTAGRKARLIERLTLALERRAIGIPAAASRLLEQMRGYRYEYRGGYYWYYGPG